MAAMKANGVTDPADLRNFMVITTEAGVTTYEVLVTGDAKVTYKVNGQRYAMGSNYPEDPVLEDWVFEGWYQTKTYEKEYTKDTTLSGDAVVYAKLRLKTDAERAAELTPTAAPTEPPAATPTEAPATVSPAGEPTPTPDGSHEAPSSTGWLVICLIGLGAVIVIIAVIMLLQKRKK